MSITTNIFLIENDWQTLELTGPAGGGDALDYLQRMTTLNIKAMKDGEFSEGTLLQATGKVSLYFKLIRKSANDYLFIVPGSSSAAFEALEKFHFAEKFTITETPSKYTYFRIAGSGAKPKIASAFAFDENKWTKPSWPDKAYAFDLGILVEKEKTADTIRELTSAGFSEIKNGKDFKTFFGEATAPAEINSNMIPLEADLDHAVHENKGCYPGQEVVERIRSMGQTPRRFTLVRGPIAKMPTDATPIKLKDPTANFDCGVITSISKDPFDSEKFVGMGFVRKMFAKPGAKFSLASNAVDVLIRNPATDEGDDEI